MAEQKSFWSTLPGIFTALAALITAVGGILVALSNIGVLDFKKDDAIVLSQKETNELHSPSPILKDQLLARYKDSGKSHFEEGKYKDAISDYEEALKIKADDAWSLRYLADSYRKNGQHHLALSAIHHSIRLDPKNAYSYKVRGLVFYDNNEYDKAISDFEKVLAIEPNNVLSIARVADSYQKKGQFKLAIEYANRAIKLDSADTFTYKVRGRIYYKIKRYSDAISDFQKVLEIEPNNAWSMDFIQKAREKMK